MVDTMIRLFESTATTFLSNGLGNLPDASKCEVTEERNGSYELELEYHISGKRYPELELRRIIVAKPNPYASPQPFRIYDISKPMNGLVTIKAEHISYDMSGYPVSPFVAADVGAALSGLRNNSVLRCPFEFSTDMSSTGDLKILKPASMRSLLGASKESILDVYGGEYEFDGFRVMLHASRGSNRGVTIRYGKNMTDLKQEENCSNVYTAVYPFWYSDEWGLIDLPEKTIAASGVYEYARIYPLDLSSEWENSYEWEDQYPSEDEIRELANKYISDNKIGVPTVSLTVSFEQLSQAEEYATLKLLETVQLCDTVNVEFPRLNVSATAKCIKTTYNVLTGKYSSIELGESQSNLASAIASQNNKVDEKLNNRPTKSFMAQAVEKATLLISGGLGGYVVMRSSTGGDHPDEILIMDTPDIETATKVWRWNKGGLGYSSNGYHGPYATAITQDGEVVADFVKTGQMSADRIHGGTMTLGGFNNINGKFSVKNASNEEIGRWDMDGIYVNGGAIYSKTDTSGASIYGGKVNVTHGNTDVGSIGANCMDGYSSYKGLVFDLEPTGSYMAWGARLKTSDKTYEAKLLYVSKAFSNFVADRLYVSCDMDFRNYEILNARINGLNVRSSFTIPNDTDCNIYSDVDFHNFELKNAYFSSLSVSDIYSHVDFHNFTISNVHIQNIKAINGYGPPYNGVMYFISSIIEDGDGGYGWQRSFAVVRDGIITFVSSEARS